MRDPTDAAYRGLFRALVGRMVLVSLLPLLAIGGANYCLFYELNRSIVIEQHANSLRYHRESVEAFLDSVTAEVSTLAHQYSLDELKSGSLERVFRVIQQQAGVFTDIGIIDSRGNHVKYIGPYDLANRNYRETEWFARVVDKGLFVSDVFLGFRGVPHFVIAVKRPEGDGFWILRATVSTDYFGKLVDAARMGRTGEAFIINSDGFYQTKPRSAGDIMTPSGFPDLTPHDDIQVSELDIDGKTYLYTTTWLSNPAWLLAFRQEVGDVYSPLRKASLLGVLMFLAGAAGAMVLAVAVARRQVRVIARADREKAAMMQRLLAAGRTAAVGEMSAGLAHEINNPLATIDTLQTWIRDLTEGGAVDEEARKEVVESARKIGEQVERCKTITQGLLKFSRRIESKPEELDLNLLLGELTTMARTRARVEGVTLQADLRPVPSIVSSPSHLQQVFVNLVNNAIDAVAGKGDGTVLIRSRPEGDGVRVEVTDNGCGIPTEHMSRIFLPFFTTKPVGKGTGLGLAICYGLVHDLGGTIHVDSSVGVGTTFTVSLPLKAPPARSVE